MDKRDRIELAELSREILRTNPMALFGERHYRLQPGDSLPQPGYVGLEYERKGILLIGMNPGGKNSSEISSNDEEQYFILKQIRSSSRGATLESFDRLNEALSRTMPTWKLFNNYVRRHLDQCDTELVSVAYLNLLKWRTMNSSGLGSLCSISWEAHTQRQIELLQPSTIVCLGTGVARFVNGKLPGTKIHTIPRMRGDNIGRKGLMAIASASRSIKRAYYRHRLSNADGWMDGFHSSSK